MKSTLTRTITGLAVVASLTLALALLSVSASTPATTKLQDTEKTGGRIEGTWRVQVTLRNCQTGAELRNFPALLTFANGGTLTGTSTVLATGLRSPDHGIWEHSDGHNYHALDEAFIFNPAGTWVSTQRLTQNIELARDGDTFFSNAYTEFFDPAGNLTSTGCATAVATRME
jgi:hypothetical protein